MLNDAHFRSAGSGANALAPAKSCASKTAKPVSTGTGSLQGFLAELLAEQRVLATPVARFSHAHESTAGKAGGTVSRYSDLIPLSTPQPGEQYAFEVDLDSCTGCKACVAGCHSLNGLDEDETWRDIGLLVGEDPAHPFQQTVTTACHHCADPACLNGCPVLAYEKDPITGIVRHLDDQCIGCQYCILKCPYDVPKYSERLGIVRKCDMCHGRLAAGEAPACVQACPTQAISIVTVSVHRSEGRLTVDHSEFLPFAPDPEITQPTTRYRSAKALPASLRQGDADTLRVQCGHTPLVAMLVLTQLGLGLLVASGWAGAQSMSSRETAAGAGLALFLGGLLASVAHLGQPFRAWRVFLNLRRSWLSREAVVFGAVAPAAVLYVAVAFSPLPISSWLALLPLTALGGIAIACSVMIYADTRREYWALLPTLAKFLGTAGISGTILLEPRLGAFALGAKLALEMTELFRRERSQEGNYHASARLLRGPLSTTVLLRFSAALVAILLMTHDHAPMGFCIFALGEFLERTLFFQAASSPRMPGLPSP